MKAILQTKLLFSAGVRDIYKLVVLCPSKKYVQFVYAPVSAVPRPAETNIEAVHIAFVYLFHAFEI